MKARRETSRSHPELHAAPRSPADVETGEDDARPVGVSAFTPAREREHLEGIWFYVVYIPAVIVAMCGVWLFVAAVDDLFAGGED